MPDQRFDETELEAKAAYGFGRTWQSLTAAAHWLSGVVVVMLLFWTVVDVVGRRFFSAPLRGTVELTEVAMIFIIFLGLAYAEENDDHVSVDLLYSRLLPKSKFKMLVLSSTISLSLVTLMTYQLYVYSQVLATAGQTTPRRGIPLWPIAAVAVIGSALFSLACVNTAITSIRRNRSANS